MDEIALVRSFRSAIPERDRVARERARRALRRGRSRRRLGPSRRVLILAAAVVAAVAVASSAFGWTSRLLDAIAGEPAPPPVREAFAVRNDARARQAIPIFRHSPTIDVIAEKTHGVMGINTSAGRVIIWAAPTKGGGTCWMIDIERLRRPGGVPNGGGGCGASPLPPDVPLHYGVQQTRVGDGFLQLLHGQVSVGVASVELRYPDGRAEILPVFERFFLSELRGDSRPSVMIVRDSRDAEIERREIRSRPPIGPAAVPKPVGPARAVIRLDTSSGHRYTFSLAPGENGQVCKIWRYRGGQGGPTCGSDLRRRVEPDEILITRFLWNEALDGKPLVGLEGVVGEDVARLEIRYTDGTVERVPVTERFVFFEIRPEHHKDEAFVLVGRAASGAELDRTVID